MTSNPAESTIMVVDDTPANLKLLDNLLGERGYRVVTFPRGDLALKAAARNPPDLILLDINMPVMNGFEVCQRLKEDPALREIPVLFISALAETTDKVKGFAAGGVDYVIKPFEFEEVLARVRTHLALQDFRRQLQRKNQELDESYHKLQELEAMRESLTHMIVHDLRSPLMGVTGYLDLLDEELEGTLSPESRELFERAQAATRELTARINTVLDVYRLEGGAMPLNLEPVDLRILAEKAVMTLGAQTRELRISMEAPSRPVEVRCDRDLVGRVLGNLLDNAVKFAPLGSTVRVVMGSEESRVRVEIHDQGPGVPPEHRETIFQKFRQVDAWKGGQRRGTGLGLAFCRMAIEAHGGSLGMDCPPEGGSVFWFVLPRGED